MTYNQIETEILEAVKNYIPDLQVELFPDEPEKYNFIHNKGVFLIGWDSANYTEPNLVFQPRILTISVTTIIRNLRIHSEGYDYLDKLREAVTSLVIGNTQRIHTLSERYVKQDGDKWYFESRFIIPDILKRGY